MSRKRIGELLVETGAVTREQLAAGLAAQTTTRQRLGATLIQLGLITEDQLVTVLSQALGIARVDLFSTPIEWAAIHMLRSRFCELNELVPFAIDARQAPRKQLVVAMADPLNTAALQEIEFTTGLQVWPHIAPLSQVRQAIIRYYHRTGPSPSGPRPLPRASEDEPQIVVGQALANDEHDAAIEAMQKREALQRAGRKSGVSGANRDLAVLFGGASDDDIERLEKKFWALMRVLARKGLITPDEFSRELEQLDS